MTIKSQVHFKIQYSIQSVDVVNMITGRYLFLQRAELLIVATAHLKISRKRQQDEVEVQ